MFFNLGAAEILVIAMVTLIAVGPEQLPGVLRKLGRFMNQARSMTAGIREEFMSGLNEVKDVADPKQWMGTGSDDNPVVPRGFAQSQDDGKADSDSTKADSDSTKADSDSTKADSDSTKADSDSTKAKSDSTKAGNDGPGDNDGTGAVA